MKQEKSYFAEHPYWTGIIVFILLVIVINIIIPDKPQISSNKNTKKEVETTPR